jgi:hypothetical protein
MLRVRNGGGAKPVRTWIYEPHPGIELKESNDFPCSFSAEPQFGDDASLISRVVSAYKYADSVFDGHGDSMWADINKRSAELHSQLMAGDVDIVTKQLRYPATNDLLCGFDEATRTIYSDHKAADSTARQAWAASLHWRLVRLAEAVGAIPIWMPNPGRPDDRHLGVEALLTALDDKLGLQIDFPNPYPDEFGLKSSRGLINHRALLAIYQAWRLSIWASEDGHTRVLEIGAGSGRTAYYSRKFGLLDYTIIDLPLANVAQANFLGRALNPSLLVLSNEEDDASRRDKIRIFGPRSFANSSERFDVALNVDSITEIDCKQAVEYFQKLAQQADVFVSINHEINSFRANDLRTLAGIPMRFLRYPHWLDHGYVEETFLFRNRAMLPPQMQAEIDRLGRIILDLRLQTRAPESGRVLARKLAELTIRRLRKRSKSGDH